MNIDDFREMLRCAERELAMRQQCYPRWVTSGKMTVGEAHRELDAQEKIVQHLEAMMATVEPQQTLPLAEGDGA